MDTRRQQLLDILKKEYIGPDPINVEGFIQGNGEEILNFEPPKVRYSAGILFPRGTSEEKAIDIETNENSFNHIREINEDHLEEVEEPKGGTKELLLEAEELINLSNAFRQSAMSLTASLFHNSNIKINVSCGIYDKFVIEDSNTGKKSTRFARRSIKWEHLLKYDELPNKETKIVKNLVIVGDLTTNLEFAIIYRDENQQNKSSIYTFSLTNTLNIGESSLKDEDCYFQVEFSIDCVSGFSPLPNPLKININDEDYQSNQLLYRNVKNYVIGHGCSAEWAEDNDKVFVIKTVIFPTYEVKPIVPNKIENVSLDMYKMSDFGNLGQTINELQNMSEKYKQWIDELENEKIDEEHKITAQRHILKCRKCLDRIVDGIKLLESEPLVARAFQYMNRAMLLQQLHYNLPLQEWVDNGDGYLILKSSIKIPDIHVQNTWYGDIARYGKWRPFQLAFILMNLRSMLDKESNDRKTVDLIWFPTGGGKTEAYLGLSAYTIFIRKLLNKDDKGTTILMRYTLRLLTAQQYERASSMICACEMIRKEKENELGQERISIGLWVGEDSTPNKMAEAVKAYDNLYKGKSEENPFVILKCPWCGAQMGLVSLKRQKTYKLPGYKKVTTPRQEIVFQCNNKVCDFSGDNFRLPMVIVDEAIYESPPTLLLGTVDKFAMLPFRPEAQKIFGIQGAHQYSPPDLIIQDELHLISGPLGSMVGHYETLVNDLCIDKRNNNNLCPKIIASTATISRANVQCHALYNCGIKGVMQFPPPGLNAGDSFFAKEDKEEVGRLYVGIMAPASSSYAMTNIRLYASLLYAAKELSVEKEEERDPYWTNLGYFNSLRELGQAETWISADIDEYLHAMYNRRMKDKAENYKANRRYIWRYEELTSRIRSEKIPMSLQNLSISYPSAQDEKRPIDICLATNMISVGVDVPRLGLMTVTGQPKTTSEYIQATSRVGRNRKAPGIVFTTYNPGKPRDRSHYEHFISYHSRLYCHVEPTSVTPFSSQLRERALHAVIIGLVRLLGDEGSYDNPRKYPGEDVIRYIESTILKRVNSIDPEEVNNTKEHIAEILKRWKNEWPQKYHDFTAGETVPLMYPAGMKPNRDWEGRGIPTPTSMRNVDSSCEVQVIRNEYKQED